jgi:hypothetical protein
LLLSRGGALLVSNSAMTLGGSLDILNGAVRVTNSTITAGSTFDVNGGSLELDSGTVDTTLGGALRVGRYSTNSASLTVKGGTVLAATLMIGVDQSQGTLTMSNGAVALSSYLQVGFSTTGSPITGGTGIVSVAGGELSVTNDVANIGSRGPGQLDVTGGRATFALLSLGEVAGVRGIVSVTGGQLVAVPGTVPVAPFTNMVRVGNQGNGELDISGGAFVCMTEMSIADNAGATGLVWVNGGQLQATDNLTSVGKYGTGQMIVSNATVLFTNVSIGRHPGADGTLIIQPNASVFLGDDLSIGRFVDIAGLLPPAAGHVSVVGGQLNLTNANIWVGRDGVGDLMVSGGTVLARSLFVGMSENGTYSPSGTAALNGGTVLLSSNLVVGASLVSTGQVGVLGGNLIVTNATGTAQISIPSGSFTLNQGGVTANTLLLTNADGQFNFPSGTLELRNLTVSNGAPFVVGDGLNPATLILLGGVYSFGNGLVIAANATVTGCGTIIGSISNGGTFNVTNCGPSATVTLGNLNQVYDGTARSVTATTTPPGLAVSLTYNGSASAPTNAGSYEVIGTVADANYAGSATNTLVITATIGTVTITGVTKAGTTATVSFSTVSNASHTLEFNTNLATTNWTAIPPAVIGNGAVMSTTDTSATNLSRLYRVRLQ